MQKVIHFHVACEFRAEMSEEEACKAIEQALKPFGDNISVEPQEDWLLESFTGPRPEVEAGVGCPVFMDLEESENPT